MCTTDNIYYTQNELNWVNKAYCILVWVCIIPVLPWFIEGGKDVKDSIQGYLVWPSGLVKVGYLPALVCDILADGSWRDSPSLCFSCWLYSFYLVALIWLLNIYFSSLLILKLTLLTIISHMITVPCRQLFRRVEEFKILFLRAIRYIVQ